MYIIGGKCNNGKTLIWERWDIREVEVNQISLTEDYSSCECLDIKKYSEVAVTPMYINFN